MALAETIRTKGVHLVVIDSGSGMLDVGYNRQLAEAAGEEYHNLEALNAAEVAARISDPTPTLPVNREGVIFPPFTGGKRGVRNPQSNVVRTALEGINDSV